MWILKSFHVYFKHLEHINSMTSYKRNTFILGKVINRHPWRKSCDHPLTTSTESIAVHKSYISIKLDQASDYFHNINLIWLRDHCRCSECYNYNTNQRIHNIYDIVNLACAKDCTLENRNLKITWTDNHISTYSLDWILKFFSNTTPSNLKVLWDRNNLHSLNIKTIDMKSFSGTDMGLKELLTSLIVFGVGLVENVPPTKLATQHVVEKISHVQRTFFGDMWEFSDSFDHQDTAYSRVALGAHTDNTYFSEAAGLQVFHCLHHDGVGGETLLVDGFNAANCLKEKHPSSFQRLTQTIIDSEFKEEGRHYVASGPILKLSPLTGDLEQIRFNIYDRAPLKATSLEFVQQFYEDFLLLSRIISDSNNHWWIKLHPGTVLIFNNWRVLHGRAAYTGYRKIAGCYIGNSDWCSKARVLGLL